MREQTLVAVDWDRRGICIDRVLAFVGPALLGVEDDLMAHPTRPQADPLVRFRVRFDADRIRNTEVHGASYHAGFVSHIE